MQRKDFGWKLYLADSHSAMGMQSNSIDIGNNLRQFRVKLATIGHGQSPKFDGNSILRHGGDINIAVR